MFYALYSEVWFRSQKVLLITNFRLIWPHRHRDLAMVAGIHNRCLKVSSASEVSWWTQMSCWKNCTWSHWRPRLGNRFTVRDLNWSQKFPYFHHFYPQFENMTFKRNHCSEVYYLLTIFKFWLSAYFIELIQSMRF